MRGIIDLDNNGAMTIMRKTVPYTMIVTAITTLLVWATMVAVPPFVPTVATKVSIWCGLVILALATLYYWVQHHPPTRLFGYNLTLTITIGLAMVPVVATISPPTWWRGICLGLALIAAGTLHIQIKWMLVDVIFAWLFFIFIALNQLPPAVSPLDDDTHIALEFAIIMLISTIAAIMLMWLRGYTLKILLQDNTRATLASLQDALTGVYNRKVLDQPLVRHEFGNANSRALYCDIRGLKQVNDQHGHAQGDKVITAVATALTHSLREEDIIIRAGGDEFIILTKYEKVDPIVIRQRALHHIQDNANIPESIWVSDLTIGVSSTRVPQHDTGEYLHALIDSADQDMYERRRQHAQQ